MFARLIIPLLLVFFFSFFGVPPPPPPFNIDNLPLPFRVFVTVFSISDLARRKAFCEGCLARWSSLFGHLPLLRHVQDSTDIN